jgi:hypothetical protein
MCECAVDSAMAAMHIAGILLGRELAQSIEKALVGPPVERDKVSDFFQYRASDYTGYA